MRSGALLTLCCAPYLFSLLLLLLLPDATASSSSAVHVFSRASGWGLSPASNLAPAARGAADLPSVTVAILQLQLTHVVVRRLRSDAADTDSFRIATTTCRGSIRDLVECSELELHSPLDSAAFDLNDLLLQVAGNASPYGCSHVLFSFSSPSPLSYFLSGPHFIACRS
jgi:hypothetical protein